MTTDLKASHHAMLCRFASPEMLVKTKSLNILSQVWFWSLKYSKEPERPWVWWWLYSSACSSVQHISSSSPDSDMDLEEDPSASSFAALHRTYLLWS